MFSETVGGNFYLVKYVCDVRETVGGKENTSSDLNDYVRRTTDDLIQQ